MVDERNAILAKIVEDPDEDTPRLVFADWLEEHGEPDWAMFIRNQIQSGIGCTAGLAGYSDWKYPLEPPLLDYSSGLIFRRGFIDEWRGGKRCDNTTMIRLLDKFLILIPTLRKVRFSTRPVIVFRGECVNRELRLECDVDGDWVRFDHVESAAQGAPSYLGLLRLRWPRVDTWSYIFDHRATTVEFSSVGAHVLESGATF
jgi:uncharacterized protein (TIGR02996 family)